MSHDFLTVAVPFDGKFARQVNAALRASNRPARAKFNQLLNEPHPFVHFISMNVVEPAAGNVAHLVMEASVDGNASAGLERITRIIDVELSAILRSAGLANSCSDLFRYLESYRLRIGAGYFTTPGAVFAGAPSLSVGRIHNEARLATRLGELLRATCSHATPLQRLESVRHRIFEDVSLKWAFIAEPVPLLAPTPEQRRFPLLRSLVGRYLWPLLIPLVAIALIAFARGSDWRQILFFAFLAEVAIVLVALVVSYMKLRADEEYNLPLDRTPDARRYEEIMERENWIAQNHLAGVSHIKPGRRLFVRLVLWAVGVLAKYRSTPGSLSGITGIHFARWLVLPGTDQLLFYSNYDGSWMSYLEDFIAKAHGGLSAIWSNTRDFPRTRRLAIGGASDGVRFKRWARRQQQPTYFWYSAYPKLSLAHIRSHAAIRHGFATISTAADAERWLQHFGIFCAAAMVERDQVPTLAFGGLSRLRHSHCLLIRFATQLNACRGWLQAVEPDLCYGDQSTAHTALVAGFSATGLTKLGLDAEGMATFPAVFRNGMSAPSRRRVLGDFGRNDSQHWQWGGSEGDIDAVVMVYSDHAAELQDAVGHAQQAIIAWGHTIKYQVTLEPLPPKGQPIREPFDFVDGISQPVMRGTPQAESRDAMHVVEPGELVLGYPNNLGYVAPTPRCSGFDVGRNGTFLVMRQLEQDKAAFEDYLSLEAAAMSGSPGAPPLSHDDLREWIAAKMVGRWRHDGRSLVRYPDLAQAKRCGRGAPDNDFLFGTEDPHGLKCPLGAHIRRANPRDSFDPGSQVQLNITNRHRILRVGRSYPARADNNAGLLFMCINADIEGQFEFVQQSWLMGSRFHGLKQESDPMLGREPMSIPTPDGPLRLRGLPDFVTVQGGGYFFMPSRSAVQFLLT